VSAGKNKITKAINNMLDDLRKGEKTDSLVLPSDQEGGSASYAVPTPSPLARDQLNAPAAPMFAAAPSPLPQTNCAGGAMYSAQRNHSFILTDLDTMACKQTSSIYDSIDKENDFSHCISSSISALGGDIFQSMVF
jgi:hypothetical protein